MDNKIGNRCKNICNAITNDLTNTFYECSAMSSELIDLVEKISCLCENDLILWKQYKTSTVFGVNPYDRMLEFALQLKDIYPHYCKKYHQVPDAVRISNDKDLKFVGFSKIKYGSDCWIDFEKYITNNKTRIIESEALEILEMTRKKYLKGNKDNAFGDILR